MTKSRDEVTRAIETTMNWNDERTLDEVEAGIVSPERSGGMKPEGELTFRDTLLDAASHGLQGRWLLLLKERRA